MWAALVSDEAAAELAAQNCHPGFPSAIAGSERAYAQETPAILWCLPGLRCSKESAVDAADSQLKV